MTKLAEGFVSGQVPAVNEHPLGPFALLSSVLVRQNFCQKRNVNMLGSILRRILRIKDCSDVANHPALNDVPHTLVELLGSPHLTLALLASLHQLGSCILHSQIVQGTWQIHAQTLPQVALCFALSAPSQVQQWTQIWNNPPPVQIFPRPFPGTVQRRHRVSKALKFHHSFISPSFVQRLCLRMTFTMSHGFLTAFRTSAELAFSALQNPYCPSRNTSALDHLGLMLEEKCGTRAVMGKHDIWFLDCWAVGLSLTETDFWQS